MNGDMKIKKSRCYVCKKKRHECWSCPLKNKIENNGEDDKEVHVYGEYVVQGTDRGQLG